MDTVDEPCVWRGLGCRRHAVRQGTHARLRAGTAGAPLRGAAPLMSAATVALLIWRNAMRSAVEQAACSAIGQETRASWGSLSSRDAQPTPVASGLRL